MSFIRAGEQGSDVYVYPCERDGVEHYMCCGDPLASKFEMRAHLLAHRAEGACVPEKTFTELDAWDRDALFDAWDRWRALPEGLRPHRTAKPHDCFVADCAGLLWEP